MTTPPKDPKLEDAAARGGASQGLEQTFLGVARLDQDAPPPAPSAPAPISSNPASSSSSAAVAPVAPPKSGSAIIAAPMISVSGERGPAPASPPAPQRSVPPQLQPAAPVRTSALQGGWQSAGVARPTSPDPTPQQGAAGWGAPAAPVAPPPELHAQAQRTFEAPSPAATGAGQQHTALASDYLRAARDAALGTAVPVAPRRGPPPLGQFLAGQRPPQQTPAPPNPVQPSPVRPNPAQPWRAQTAAPMDIPVNLAESFIARPASAPPPTLDPPATAQLPAHAPLPLAAPSSALFGSDADHRDGPPSLGTQASVAPPLLDTGASFGAPDAGRRGAVVDAGAFRGRQLHEPPPFGGTLVERAADAASPAASPWGPPAGSFSGTHTGRFEPVPSARSSLQATGFGLQIPIDQSSSDWGRAGGEPPESARGGRGRAPARLGVILIAALLTVVILVGLMATVGRQWLAERSRRKADRIETVAANDAPDRATLTNLPSAAAPAIAPAIANTPLTPPSVAPSSGAGVSNPGAAAAIAQAGAQPSVSATARKLDPAAAKAATAAAKAAEAAATPESRLAAQAGRLVLAARYADALPLYRELQHGYPQNTAYAAMVGVLEQKATAGKPVPAQPFPAPP